LLSNDVVDGHVQTVDPDVVEHGRNLGVLVGLQHHRPDQRHPKSGEGTDPEADTRSVESIVPPGGGSGMRVAVAMHRSV
jgi:hypothetical protein